MNSNSSGGRMPVARRKLRLVTVFAAAASCWLAWLTATANAGAGRRREKGSRHRRRRAAPRKARPGPLLAEVRTDVHGGTVCGELPAAHTATAAAPRPGPRRPPLRLPPAGHRRRGADHRHRRRLRQSHRRSRPGRLPQHLRPAGVHHGQRLLPQGQPARRGLPAAGGIQGWGVEIALDLDMVSAACPACQILLVEADDAARRQPRRLGGHGRRAGRERGVQQLRPGRESRMPTRRRTTRTPASPILASSGDYGFTTAAFPAVLRRVIAVGGTTLTRADNTRGWTETAWTGAGSGCSAWVAKPAWQHDPNCPGRMTADVSAVADPRPARPSTAPPTACPAGASSAAPAPHRRSSPAS